MKLYYSPGACSLVVRIVLNELGLSFESEAVDLRAKKTAQGEDYLAINPKGAVPALRLDTQELLTENQVILQYLADNFSTHTALAPMKELKRYQTLEWLNYISTEVHKSMGLLFNPNLSEETKKALVLPALDLKFATLDKRLGQSHYLMGEAFTLPDAYLFVMLTWSHVLKVDVSAYKHLGEFKTRMEAREAVKKSLQEEGLVKD